MSNEKDVQAKLKEISKKIGVEIRFASEEGEIEYYSVGVEAIDKFTGGGLVKGRFTVIYGSKSSGKSTLSYNAIASLQRQNLRCAIIDMEHSFDKNRATSLGIDTSKLILIEECETAEQAMDMVIALAQAKIVDFIVIDSVQAMSPKGEQESKKGVAKSVEDDTQALLARKLGQFFRMCATPLYKANMGALLIGQVRTMGIGSYIVKDGLSGGKALEHYPWEIIYVRKGQKADAPVEKYKEVFEDPDGKIHKETKERILGFDCVLKMEKTKASASVRENEEVHVPFYFETGFNEPKPKEEVVAPTLTEGDTRASGTKINKTEKPAPIKPPDGPKKKRGRPAKT